MGRNGRRRQRLPILRVAGDSSAMGFTGEAWDVFVSALETVKGFEFSLVIISNCGAKVIPSPALPLEERWREARRLYVR